MLNENGVSSMILLYHYEDQKYMMVVNAANIEKDWLWCRKQNTMGAELENASDHMALLAVQDRKPKTCRNLPISIFRRYRIILLLPGKWRGWTM